MADVNTLISSADKIYEAISITLSPLASQVERKQAYQVVNEFHDSPLCSDVGIYLFNNKSKFDTAIRKCGLQLVEHYIISKWNQCDELKRHSFKLEAVKLIEHAQFNEPTYLKEAVVKVIVEIIKRSWPQQWDSLFQDLSNLQALGDAQLELVLIILMRLSEDINGLDAKLTSMRMKEMLTTLNDNMEDLFIFFIETLQTKVMLLKEKIDDTTLRLAEASIFTITAYASWVKFDHLIAKNKILFQVLVWLLEVDKLKSHVCNCLSIIFERKAENEKRVELLIILSEDALGIVKTAALAAYKKASECEEEYQFLKNLVNMMSNFGRFQIASLWGDEKGFSKRPDYFDEYLKLMLDFSKHESMVIGISTAKLWKSFFTHKLIQKDKMLRSLIPELLNCLFVKMTRIGNPLLRSSPGNCYSVMDFSDIEDFNEAFGDARCITMCVIKLMTELSPDAVLMHCLSNIKDATSAPPPSVSSNKVDEAMQTMHYIRWEALAQYSRNAFSCVYFKSRKNISPDVVNLFNDVLNSLLVYKCETPVFLIPVVSCMEAIFPVFKYSQDYLLAAMQMLIGVISTSSTTADQQQGKLKRQACGSFSHLCKEIPEILVNIFADLQTLFADQFQQQHLTNHDKAMLLEGLLTISNHLQDDEVQKDFICKMFEYAGRSLDNVKDTLDDPMKFAVFFGLNKNCVEDDELKNRRKEVMMALYIYQAVSRCFAVTNEKTMDDNPTEQAINESTQKYPWVQLMINVLPTMFDLAKQFCLLWTIEDHLIPNALSQSKIEAQSVANKSDDDANLGNLVQNHLMVLHGLIYTTLFHCGTCIGPALYSLSELQVVMVEKLVKQWTHLPNYRLRKIWRFVKGFVLSCPAANYEALIGPFLSVAIKDMFERLCVEWKKIEELVKTKKENMSDGEGNNEKAEIIEERNMYNLSKEFIDIIVSLCVFKREKEKEGVKISDNSAEVFGKLGGFLLLYEGTNLTLICTLFTAVTWPDASVVYRISKLLVAIVKKVFLSGSPVNPEIPNQLLLLLLQGLQLHGADDVAHAAITNAALDIYLLLREQYPGVVRILLMIPTCTEESLKKFDLDIFTSDQTPTENQKRKAFRKLVEGACGKTVSQLYCNNVEIRDLPPLAPRLKKHKSVLEEVDSDSGLCSFFAGDT